MKASYGEDAPSYDAKHWHRQFKCGGRSVEPAIIPVRTQSAIAEDTSHLVETTILEDLIQYIKIGVLSADKTIHDDMHMQNFSSLGSKATHTFLEARTCLLFQPLFSHVPSKARLFNRLITQDETWGPSLQSRNQGSAKTMEALDSPARKRHVTLSAGKVMLTVFWDECRTVMMVLLAKRTTIIRAYYAALL